MDIKKPQLVKVEAFNIFYIGGFATPSLPLGRRVGGGVNIRGMGCVEVDMSLL